MIEITAIRVEELSEYNQLSGSIGNFGLWYRFPKNISPEVRGDAFLAASLIPAMCRNEDIRIEADIPVSPMLLENITQIQDAFVLWGPYLRLPLKRVNVYGGLPSPARGGNDDTVAFYSGGVDGNYTFLKNQANLDYLLFAKGIDMQLSSHELYKQAYSRNSNYLKARGMPLHGIETNVRFLGHENKISWNVCFGGGLSSIALAGGFKACYIASGLSYADMYPHGSNIITDPLWRNEHSLILHDGAEKTRLEKIRHIMADPMLRDVLRVCWQDESYNCGKCEKCLRTMCSLRALKIHASTFPECTNAVINKRIRKLQLYNEYDLAFLNENLSAALENNDIVLAKVLERVKRNYNLKKALKLIDDSLFGGKLQSINQSQK